jgi:ADP-heptose:LPS heptosyltransferase
LNDFSDTAALVHHLDLVICADTVVCHVAGALAKPVWIVVPWASDWRWFMDRSDSPWYPTMRIFRQPRAGDWNAAVAEVARELRELVNQKKPES